MRQKIFYLQNNLKFKVLLKSVLQEQIIVILMNFTLITRKILLAAQSGTRLTVMQPLQHAVWLLQTTGSRISELDLSSIHGAAFSTPSVPHSYLKKNFSASQLTETNIGFERKQRGFFIKNCRGCGRRPVFLNCS